MKHWFRSGSSIAGCVVLLLLIVAGCVAFLQRELVLAHWHVRAALRGDNPEWRADWLRKHCTVVAPIACTALEDPDPNVCRRAGRLIRDILGDLVDPTEPDAVQLSLVAASKLRNSYERLSAVGRSQAEAAAHLLLTTHLQKWSPHVPTVLDSAGTIFLSALDDPDVKVREGALQRLPQLWPAIAMDGSSEPLVREWLGDAYKSAVRMMTSQEPTIRLAAGVACAKAPFAEFDFVLASLLEDGDLNVARGVLMALAESRHPRLHMSQKTNVVPFLGDENPKVVAAAEKVLRQSGVSEDRLALLKLQVSPVAAKRVEAIRQAHAALHREGRSDSSPLVAFLVDLSFDKAPEVRLAFVAAAEQTPLPRLHARLRTLADRDPDAGVRDRAKAVEAKLRIASKP